MENAASFYILKELTKSKRREARVEPLQGKTQIQVHQISEI